MIKILKMPGANNMRKMNCLVQFTFSRPIFFANPYSPYKRGPCIR